MIRYLTPFQCLFLSTRRPTEVELEAMRALGCDTFLLIVGHDGEIYDRPDIEYINPIRLSITSLKELERNPSDNLAIGLATQIEDVLDGAMRTDTIVIDPDREAIELVVELLRTHKGDKPTVAIPTWNNGGILQGFSLS